MLTHREPGVSTVRSPQHRLGAGGLLAVAIFAMLAGAIWRTPLPNAPPQGSNTQALGAAFLTEHVLAFEVLSLLLLGAVLGAIVIARRRDAGDEREARGPVVPARRKLQLGGSR
jgi:NADH-quinone oxidoreductase subunit J